eukprot:3404260-Pyramimonas_sp.AAC.1
MLVISLSYPWRSSCRQGPLLPRGPVRPPCWLDTLRCLGAGGHFRAPHLARARVQALLRERP